MCKKRYNNRYIVLELCVSTLHHYIVGKYEAMPLEPISALYQMACGLQHIHSHGLVHRDITPQNVLIQHCGDQSIVLKISDFGFCKSASERGSFSISKDGKGTRHFIAPEMLLQDGKDEQQRRATIACDIFSLGCLFFCFLTKGGHPFSTENDELMININIRSDKHNLDGKTNFMYKFYTAITFSSFFFTEPGNSKLFAREIIKNMIQHEPGSRLKIDEVVVQLELDS